MFPQTKTLPFNDVDGVKFNVLIKTNLLLKNGENTVMLTAVPEGLSFDDAMAGIRSGAVLSERVEMIQHEIYSLINGKAETFGNSIPSILSDK